MATNPFVYGEVVPQASFVDREDLRLRDTASPFPADPRFAQPPRR